MSSLVETSPNAGGSRNNDNSNNSSSSRSDSLTPQPPPNVPKDREFFIEKHIQYVKKVANDVESFEFVVSQHFRMSGVYWGLTALYILGVDIKIEMDTASLIDWVMSCQDESGGFGGSKDHDPHMLYTLSALQILALCDALERVNREKVAKFIASLQRPDGSFFGDQWGEIDTRFSYCALSAMSILGRLHSGEIDVAKAVEFVGSCRNFDGGFGAVPGAESHAGQIFCCIGALSIGNALHYVDEDLLGWWLSERQCDSGGLNGRPEKQADVCYSWWILSSLSILGRVSWINRSKLCEFILNCQDAEDGGISDRPTNMADIFHTFFGISGLSLLGFLASSPLEQGPKVGDDVDTTTVHGAASAGRLGLHGKGVGRGRLSTDVGASSRYALFREIDPTYALPKDVVEAMGLQRQTLTPPSPRA